MTAGLEIAPDFRLDLDVVTEATAIVATRGAGKSSTSAVIIEEAFAVGVQTVVFDRTGVYWGLRSNARGTGAGLGIYVLGGPHGDAPLEPAAGRLIADLVVDSGHSFVLDLSDLSKGQAARFAADFLERLYDRKARSRTTTLLVMDEAHFYAPQTPRGGFKGDAARLMGAMEDVVGLGRSRGLGVVLTTQRTQALNKAVLDLIETLLVMRMLSPRARDAVQDWIREKHEDDREGVIATLESLPTGTAWVWSPLRGILVQVPVRRIRTFDSYATPKPGQSRVEPTKRAVLDLEALGAEILATAERAKENDPAEIRKQLRLAQSDVARLSTANADLERRLEEAEARPSEPTVVEVSVLTDDDRARIAAITHHFDEAHGMIVSAYDAMREVVAPLAAPPQRIVHPVRKRGGHQPAAAGPPPTVPPPRPEPTGVDLNGGASVSGPQQRILDALRWFEAIRVREPRRSPLAAVAKASPKSSGFEKNVSTLRTLGLIDYPSVGRISLTDAGRASAASPSATPTVAELHDAVCGMVSGPQATLLRALIAVHPGSLTRDELADATGYSAASSGFEKNVSTLRSFELVDYPDKGHVRAADILFPR